jgi:hypothetical protein
MLRRIRVDRGRLAAAVRAAVPVTILVAAALVAEAGLRWN